MRQKRCRVNRNREEVDQVQRAVDYVVIAIESASARRQDVVALACVLVRPEPIGEPGYEVRSVRCINSSIVVIVRQEWRIDGRDALICIVMDITSPIGCGIF